MTPFNAGSHGQSRPSGPDESALQRTITETIHYVDQDGRKVFADVTASVSFKRAATSAQETAGDETATGDVTAFDAIVSRVLPGYFADKARIAKVNDLAPTAPDIDETVTYARAGRWVLSLAALDAITYPNDPLNATAPKDPRAPDYPVIPHHDGYKPKGPDGVVLGLVDATDPTKGYVPPPLPADLTRDTAITYVATDQTAFVRFVDGTNGDIVKTLTLIGDEGDVSTYTTADDLEALANLGYAVVADDYPAGGVRFENDQNGDQRFTVQLEHRIAMVTPERPGHPGTPIDPVVFPSGPKWPAGVTHDDLTATITETIRYVHVDGTTAAKTHTAAIVFVRSATVDQVTGVVTYGEWAAADRQVIFEAVASPVIAGFTADQITVGERLATPTVGAINVTVTYTPGEQKASVTYVDDTTESIITAVGLTGERGEMSDYTTEDAIAEYERNGYTLVADDFPIAGLSFDPNHKINRDFTVNLVHTFIQATPNKPGQPGAPIDPDNPAGPKWPAGSGKDALIKAVTETIHYVYVDGSQAAPDATATVTYTRIATVDEVAGTLTYAEWTADGDSTFAAVKSPLIIGYTPDKPVVAPQPITKDSADVTVTVTYLANPQAATVTYIDDTTGEVLATDALDVTGGRLVDDTAQGKIAGYLNAGYDLVADDFPAGGVTLDETDTAPQDFTVHLKHRMTTASPAQPGTPGFAIDPNKYPTGPVWPDGTTQADLTKAVTATVRYLFSDGRQAAVAMSQKVTLMRAATVDEVTGQVIDGEWTVEPAESVLATAPTIDGYQAELTQVDGPTAAGDDKDSTITMTYTEVAQPSAPEDDQGEGDAQDGQTDADDYDAGAGKDTLDGKAETAGGSYAPDEGEGNPNGGSDTPDEGEGNPTASGTGVAGPPAQIFDGWVSKRQSGEWAKTALEGFDFTVLGGMRELTRLVKQRSADEASV